MLLFRRLGRRVRPPRTHRIRYRRTGCLLPILSVLLIIALILMFLL